MHPTPPRASADSAAARHEEGTIEGSEEPASPRRRCPSGTGQGEHRGAGEHRRLVYHPTFAAHRDVIACGEGHACTMATRIPREAKPYVGVSANLWIQNGNSCAQMGRRVVEKFHYT